MQLIPFDANAFVPAGHENPTSPGVLKKILLEKTDIQRGRIQMVNWAKMGVGKRFSRHYHEDMQEIFIIVSGHAEITIGAESVAMRRGDAVVIDPREIHQMWNSGTDDVEYLAVGITTESGGKTVLVEENQPRIVT